MSEEKTDVEKTLDDMRKITMLTGQLSRVHELNLQKWPFIVFEGVESVSVKYDLTKELISETGENTVSFYLEISKEKDQEFSFDLTKRCEVLHSWIKDMFWPEIELKIYANDVKRYSAGKSKEK